MKVILISIVLLVAISSGAHGAVPRWNPFTSKPTTPSPANTTTTSAPTVTVALPCVPGPVLSPSLQTLQTVLPPQLASLVTPANVQALHSVGTLAGLATSAATGNPVAIIKLVAFLASPDNPIGPLLDMSKQILPILNPIGQFPQIQFNLTHSVESISNFTNSVGNEFNELQQSVFGIFHKPTTTTTTSSTERPPPIQED